MKVGDLVMFKYNPYIGVVMEARQDFALIHWLDDGYMSWEDGRELKGVKKV